MRTIPSHIVDQLFQEEGKRNILYYDSMHIPTIGVGHNLYQPISDAAVKQILNDDLVIAATSLENVLPWVENLDIIRYAVLIDLTFNMGIDRLLKFEHMLQYIKDSVFDKAALELLNSNYANQVGQRAKNLARQLETGEW